MEHVYMHIKGHGRGHGTSSMEVMLKLHMVSVYMTNLVKRNFMPL